jgi:hypothetical protein
MNEILEFQPDGPIVENIIDEEIVAEEIVPEEIIQNPELEPYGTSALESNTVEAFQL